MTVAPPVQPVVQQVAVVEQAPQPQAQPPSTFVAGVGSAYRTQDDKPFRTTCQHCHSGVTTRIRQEKGLGVYGSCGLCCVLGCWLGCCLIPCCLDVAHVLPSYKHFSLRT
mmetsp:Transcript_23825/g.44499  ORF Transcript_23825/g.44499 Transcript_23825/m.44499 type:complete len:110 (-) Transcript_23825:89-418(-)